MVTYDASVVVFLLFSGDNVGTGKNFVAYRFSRDRRYRRCYGCFEKKEVRFSTRCTKFHFSIKDEVLHIDTKDEAAVSFRQILKEKPLNNPYIAKIEWGVERFCKGANWAEGNNRLPTVLIVVLGSEKLPSGIGFLPLKVSTFLCPFIGEKEKVGKHYFGKLYKKCG